MAVSGGQGQWRSAEDKGVDQGQRRSITVGEGGGESTTVSEGQARSTTVDAMQPEGVAQGALYLLVELVLVAAVMVAQLDLQTVVVLVAVAVVDFASGCWNWSIEWPPSARCSLP